jgi:hypothetical protein
LKRVDKSPTKTVEDNDGVTQGREFSGLTCLEPALFMVAGALGLPSLTPQKHRP